MVSLTTDRFWKAFNQLPGQIQTHAKKAYELWQKDPYHDSLQFKRVHLKKPIYSVRIGIKEDDTIIWFWIGSHADYDKLIDSM